MRKQWSAEREVLPMCTNVRYSLIELISSQRAAPQLVIIIQTYCVRVVLFKKK